MHSTLEPGISHLQANVAEALAVLDEEPQCMQRMRTLHDQLTSVITTLNERVGEALASQESEFLRAYRAHMFAVQRELTTLRAKADDATLSLAKNDRILGLERERDWYRGEAVRLDSACEGLKGEIEVLREKVAVISEDSTWMEGQLREYVRNEKRYLKQISELQRKLKQAGLSATMSSTTIENDRESISFRGAGALSGSSALKDSRSNRDNKNFRSDSGVPTGTGVRPSSLKTRSQDVPPVGARFNVDENKYGRYGNFERNPRNALGSAGANRTTIAASTVSSVNETGLRFSEPSVQVTSTRNSSRVSSAGSSVLFSQRPRQVVQSIAHQGSNQSEAQGIDDGSIFGDDDLGGIEGHLGGIRQDILDSDLPEDDTQ